MQQVPGPGHLAGMEPTRHPPSRGADATSSLRRLLTVTAVGLLCACGSQGAATRVAARPAAGTASTPAATPVTVANAAPAEAPAAPATTATPRPTCTSSGPASASWVQPWSRAVGASPIVSAAASGDTLTLHFDRGTPAFETRPQGTPHFSRDPSGQPVTLAGSAGVAVVLRGFRGDGRNYTGPEALTSQGSVLLEVRQIGDFEGVVSWAAGLSAPGCASVTTTGSTLTIRFVPVGGKG